MLRPALLDCLPCCDDLVIAVTCALPDGDYGRRLRVKSVTYQNDIDDWLAGRIRSVAGPEGWATLVGLYWFKEGDNRFGSDKDNDLVLANPDLPANVGVFTLAGSEVRFRVGPGADVRSGGRPVTSLILVTDPDSTVLTHGSVSFYVIRRGPRFGLRVKDSSAEARTHFKGFAYFPLNQKWRLEARFVPYSPMRQIRTINVVGMDENMASPGALEFHVDGKLYRLDTVLEHGEADYFVMFADMTNGKQTYGAGRFLYVKPPLDGVTVLDFNKSYNPPCAFSPYATCPLPPPQNRLPIAVEAGELRYADADY